MPKTDPLHHMDASMTIHPQPPSGGSNSLPSTAGSMGGSGSPSMVFFSSSRGAEPHSPFSFFSSTVRGELSAAESTSPRSSPGTLLLCNSSSPNPADPILSSVISALVPSQPGNRKRAHTASHKQGRQW
ncbi:hypothetical protein FKM82_010948 [Ascaphus truei]